MLVGVLNLVVIVNMETKHYWPKDSRSLCEKLKAKFKVQAKAWNRQSEFGISVVSLDQQESRLKQLFDKILETCEASGIGRVEVEVSFIDDIELFREGSETDNIYKSISE